MIIKTTAKLAALWQSGTDSGFTRTYQLKLEIALLAKFIKTYLAGLNPDQTSNDSMSVDSQAFIDYHPCRGTDVG